MDRKELIEKAKEHSKYDIPADTQCLLLQMAAELEKDERQNRVKEAHLKEACYEVLKENFAYFLEESGNSGEFINFVDGVVQTEIAVMKLLNEKNAAVCSKE